MPSPTPPKDLPEDPGVSYRPTSRAGKPVSGYGSTISVPDAASSASPSSPAEPGEPLPNAPPQNAYLLRREVDRGTFGEVWEAVQVALKRVVAVKKVRRDSAEEQDPEQLVQSELLFLKEALTAGQLNHPNVVPVYDLGRDEQGRPLLAMKLVDGSRWDKLIASDESPRREFLVRHISILLKVGQAVAFAHSRGIIHRDLKPQQVMVGDYGEAFLMDWGLAVAVEEGHAEGGFPSSFATQRTDATSPAGTTAFMAPEQTDATPERLGFATDVYLLGGCLYYILTGTAPHAFPTAWEAFQHAARGIVTPPDQAVPDREVPADLADLCMHALHPEPGKRIASVQEYCLLLESWLLGARRREESRTLTEQARLDIQHDVAAYEVLEQADSRLTRALLLWPDNPDALRLRREVLTRYTRAALRAGDVALAGTQAQRLTEPELRADLLSQVESAARRARALARQRRLGIRTAFILMIAAVCIGLFFAHSRARHQARQSHWAAQSERLKQASRLAQQKAEEEHQRAELYRALINHTTASLTLVDMFTREVPPPTSLKANEDWSVARLGVQPALVDRLRRDLSQFDALRQRLSAGGVPLGQEPVEILLGRSVLELLSGDAAGARKAYRHLQAASLIIPRDSRIQMLLGVASSRAGESSSAALHLSQAVQRASFSDPHAHHVPHSFLREVHDQQADLLSADPEALVIESWPGGRNADRYRELTANWTDSQNMSNYKSAAPFLTSYLQCGTRRLHFYEPYAARGVLMPGRARYTPGFTGTRKCHVYVTWPGEANATPVYYRVRHSRGEAVFPLMQNGIGVRGEPNGNRWVPLGEFEFHAGADQYVEIEVGDDVRPFAAERHGQVSADAVLFMPRPLPADLTAAQVVDPNADPAGAPLLPRPTGAPAALKDLFRLSPGEAVAEARRTGRPLFIFSYYPISSCFVHPMNEQKDYCENLLLSHPAILALIGDRFIPTRIDLTHDDPLQHLPGLQTSSTSLRVVDGSTSPSIRMEIRGTDLLLSPAELAARLEKTN